MKRFLYLTLLATAAFAQANEKEKPAPQGVVSRIFEVKHADVNSLRDLLGIFGAHLVPNRDMKVISVSGTRATLDAIEEALKKLDVPPVRQPNIDITAYLLVASQLAAPGAVPAELQPVVSQLKGVLNYQNFRVLDTLVLRTSVKRKAELSGLATAGAVKGTRPSYSFSLIADSVDTDAKGRVVRLSQLGLSMRIPYLTDAAQLQFHDAKISADIDLREGQRVVVGKTSFDAPDNALILVLSLKIVD